MTVQVGQEVLYVPAHNRTVVWPSWVMRVYEGRFSRVDLWIMSTFNTVHQRSQVPYDGSASPKGGTWHYIPVYSEEEMHLPRFESPFDTGYNLGLSFAAAFGVASNQAAIRTLARTFAKLHGYHDDDADDFKEAFAKGIQAAGKDDPTIDPKTLVIEAPKHHSDSVE